MPAMNLPPMIRFMLRHALNGIVIGCVLTLALIRFDVWGIGSALEADSSGLATFILFFQMAMTFGGVAIGVAVMALGED